jgi:hypothetical protein
MVGVFPTKLGRRSGNLLNTDRLFLNGQRRSERGLTEDKNLKSFLPQQLPEKIGDAKIRNNVANSSVLSE